MKIDRIAAFAPRTRALAEELDELTMPCIGCKDCRGMCMDLIEIVRLPDVLLKEKRA